MGQRGGFIPWRKDKDWKREQDAREYAEGCARVRLCVGSDLTMLELVFLPVGRGVVLRYIRVFTMRSGK
jgi:hypothetical protein